MFKLYKGETLQQWRLKSVNLRHRKEQEIGSFPIQDYRYWA